MPFPLRITIGQKFGYFTVLEEAPKKKNLRFFRCNCICGKEVEVRLSSLSSGISKSCGCNGKIKEELIEDQRPGLHFFLSENLQQCLLFVSEDKLDQAAVCLNKEIEHINYTEEWRKVVRDDRYKVSSFGRIIGPRGERQLCPNILSGYFYFGVENFGRSAMYSVHILVAESFIPKSVDTLDVSHIDGIIGHNAVRNLRYCTRKENIADKWIHNTIGGENGKANILTWKEIDSIRKESNMLSNTELAVKYNVGERHIRSIISHEKWKEESRTFYDSKLDNVMYKKVYNLICRRGGSITKDLQQARNILSRSEP